MEQFNTIPTSGNWADIAGILDANFLRCWTALVQSQSLIGLDGSNYKGMYTSASALPDDMTEAGWALVGSSLSALQLYVFNDGATDWALFSNETYNFTSWTEFQTQLDALSTQVATIGSELDKKLESDDGGIGDLDLADPNGNVLARFYNGHIKTKNFDSSQISTGEKKLKICVIGNSYSCDSFMYVPFILKNYGIDIELGIYYRGGASLQNHIDEWLTGNSSSFYYIDTETMNAWTATSNATPYNAVRFKQWDIVVIQQSSTDSVTASTFTAARELEELILDNVGRTIVFGWNININRASSGSDYTAIANTILDNIEATCRREPIDIIFPYGTAIFDARTNQTLAAIGAGGNLWASDMIHLQEGLPCYIAALANVQALFNRYYPQFSVMNDTTRPTAANITAWNVQGQNGSSVGVTEDNCRLAQICAVLANKFNFEITTIYG